MIGIIVFRAIFKSFFTNCYLHKRILPCHNFPKSATHLSPIPRSNPCSFRGITHHSNWSKQWILYGLIPKKHDLYYWMKISRSVKKYVYLRMNIGMTRYLPPRK